jgi:hypothetical protein
MSRMKSEIRRIGPLEIDEDFAFQKRHWIWQKVGLAGLLAFLILALTGLLGGNGPLAQRKIQRTSFAVTAPTLLRRRMPATLVVQLKNPAQRLRITGVGEALSLRELLVPERMDGSTSVFEVESEHAGKHALHLQVDEREELKITFWSLP